MSTAELIVKETAAVTPGGDDAQSQHGTFEVILSTPTRDRDGEEVKAAEWVTPLPEHITFDIDHGMSVATTVGSGVPSIDDQGRLVVAGAYASTPLAQQTRALVNEGHIRTTSVAFLRSTSGEKGAVKVTRELLNGAFVAVPANPEALVLASKAGARNSSADQGHIQAAHDHMAALGATCGPTDQTAKDADAGETTTDTDHKNQPDEDADADSDSPAATAAAADAAAAHAARLREVHAAALRAIRDHT